MEERRSIPWLLLALVAALTLPAIFLGPGGDVTSEASDQNHHHLPLVRHFEAQLPSPDLRDYSSATAPLWHLLLAAQSRLGLGSEAALRVSGAVALGMLAIAVWCVARRWVGPRLALAMSMPAVLSPYSLSGAIWVTTDVPANALAAWALALALDSSGRIGARASIVGILAAASAGVRQSMLWVLAPLTIAWSIAARHGRVCGAASWVPILLSLALPLGVVATLVAAWGGLVPPSYRDLHGSGANWATPAIALSLCAVWGVPFLGVAARHVCGSRWTLWAALAGLAVAVAVPSSFDTEHGRWGGPIWSLIHLLPAPGARSIVVLILAPIGAASLCSLWLAAREAGRGSEGTILLTAIAAMVAASTANAQAWERYLDLPLLILLPWLAAAGARDAHRDRHALLAGAWTVAGLQWILSLWMVYRPLIPGG